MNQEIKSFTVTFEKKGFRDFLIEALCAAGVKNELAILASELCHDFMVGRIRLVDLIDSLSADELKILNPKAGYEESDLIRLDNFESNEIARFHGMLVNSSPGQRLVFEVERAAIGAMRVWKQVSKPYGQSRITISYEIRDENLSPLDLCSKLLEQGSGNRPRVRVRYNDTNYIVLQGDSLERKLRATVS